MIENEVYDLCLSTVKPVRFIVCNKTNNPILALFAGDPKKFVKNYYRIQQETDLFDQVGVYFDVFREFYGELLKKMYTAEDFKREYAPKPVALPSMSEHLKPKNLEQEVWIGVMFKLFERENEETLAKERIEMVLNILDHRYEDEVPVDEWQPLLGQCEPEQLKTLVDQAWGTDSLEEFGNCLAQLSMNEQQIDAS